MPMHYLETGSLDPCYNLALEQFVLEYRTEGDWLMLWQQNDTKLTLLFTGTGTHSDLF